MRDINFEESNENIGTSQWADTSSKNDGEEVTDIDKEQDKEDTDIVEADDEDEGDDLFNDDDDDDDVEDEKSK